MDYQLPEGVALELPANSGLDLNSHYVNRTANSLRGEVFVNLHYQDKKSVKHIAKIISFNHTDIELPSRSNHHVNQGFLFSRGSECLPTFFACARIND